MGTFGVGTFGVGIFGVGIFGVGISESGYLRHNYGSLGRIFSPGRHSALHERWSFAVCLELEIGLFLLRVAPPVHVMERNSMISKIRPFK